MNKNFNILTIGILGGGQLGKMLLQKAADYDLRINVLDPDPLAPCRHLCSEFFTGSFRDFNTVYQFGKKCDIVTIEIEHVNVEALEKLENEGVMVFPQPRVIKIVQDKGEQKLFFSRNGIPTAEFKIIDNRNELSNEQFPVIQKLRKGGYDGRGVFRIGSANDIQHGFDAPSVIEKMISFNKELSVIVARKSNGEVKTFPAVEMDFDPEANLVEFLFSPADIDAQTEKRASGIAMKVAGALDMTGILAVEMFLTNEGEILVNEIAPRPHNSGHHTIEGNETSQYEQLIRVLLDLPLGDTTILQPAVMVNLLGEKNFEGPVVYENMEKALSLKGVHIHLYGKKITKPFRKMGHATITAKSLEEAKKKAFELKNILRIISE